MDPASSKQLKHLARRYLAVDMDRVSAEEISQDIATLQETLDRAADDPETREISGLVAQIIPHLYIARGLASPQTPRHIDFYRHMQECRALFRQLGKFLG